MELKIYFCFDISTVQQRLLLTFCIDVRRLASTLGPQFLALALAVSWKRRPCCEVVIFFDNY